MHNTKSFTIFITMCGLPTFKSWSSTCNLDLWPQKLKINSKLLAWKQVISMPRSMTVTPLTLLHIEPVRFCSRITNQTDGRQDKWWCNNIPQTWMALLGGNESHIFCLVPAELWSTFRKSHLHRVLSEHGINVSILRAGNERAGTKYHLHHKTVCLQPHCSQILVW